jgi:hypothetical protein
LKAIIHILQIAFDIYDVVLYDHLVYISSAITL